MIAETLVLLALLSSGSMVARAAGISGWGVPAVGLGVGVAMHVAAVFVVVVSPLPCSPEAALLLVLLTSGCWWLLCLRRGEAVSIAIPATAATIAALVGLVAWFRAGNLVNLTADSFRYLTTAGLLSAGRLEEASPFLLESRVLAVPALHATAGLGGESYLRSATPLLAIACVAILAWLVSTGLAERIAAPRPEVLAVLAAALLATNNRFVFHAFYLNGHLALATWLLLISGLSWLILDAGPSADPTHLRRLAGLQALVLPAIVLSRPEGGLLAILVLLPLVVSRTVDKRVTWMPLAALGVSMLAWQGFLSVAYQGAGQGLPTSVVGLLIVGGALLTVAAILRTAGNSWMPTRALWLAESALWLAVAVAVALDHSILAASAEATMLNLAAAGRWGGSILVLAALVVAVMLLTDAAATAALRFPITTFVPLSILLAYLRGSAYRVGPGDSLNRSLLHIVPLTVLFIASAAASERWGFRRRSGEGRVASEPPGRS